MKLNGFNRSVDMGSKSGLVTTDSYHAAVMEQLGIKHIATNDSDIERVDFMEVWNP